MTWQQGSERVQRTLTSRAYDGWYTPDGECKAEFHRTAAGFLVRFPDEADFEIAGSDYSVRGWPVPGMPADRIEKLFNNGIAPILGNHRGGLFLHGSAVSFDDHAVAFLGLSRSGKTTLAGSFARDGFPFLTEDVIDLDPHNQGYHVRPKRSALRVFVDTAEHLLGKVIDRENPDEKFDLSAEDVLPFSDEMTSLLTIFVLGTDHGAPLSVRKLDMPEALTALLPHSFILDVEDKERLKAHFDRLADLSERIACYSLDYPREYSELRRVRDAVLKIIRENG